MKLSCSKLQYCYDSNMVLRQMSIDFPERAFTGIIGPNGSGKSTLLKLLSGILKLQQGDVHLDGLSLQELARKSRAKKIAYLPQKTDIQYDLSVLDVVMLGRTPYRKVFAGYSEHDFAYSYEALNKVGLKHFAQRRMHSLSGGEFQRVVLARLLATNADILLLDEAITSFDIHFSLSFLHLAKDLVKEGKQILLVVHQLELAYRYCDYILLMSKENNYFGKTRQIMNKKNLKEVFRVNMQIHDKNLAFHL